MSSRRQFHRALRRHPAWPTVMEQTAARAKLHKEQEAARAKLQKEEAVARSRWRARKAASRARLNRTLRRNRASVIALIAAGALLVLLTGLAVADGQWVSRDLSELDKSPPPARFGAATTFDETNGEMLIFGGFSSPTTPNPVPGTPIQELPTPGTIVARNDTRGFPGGAYVRWTNRNPIHSPSPRGYASMVYDGARKNVVLFGGATYRANPAFGVGAVYGDTWTWNGSDWTLLDPPKPRPDPRQNASMVYDAHRKVVVLFGGRGADGLALNDTWTWNGFVWKKERPPVSPGPRHSAAMEYDLCRGEAVLFGGNASIRSGTNFASSAINRDSVAGETWTWNGITWTPKNPLVSPPARIGASMLYSSATGQVMLYGGLTTTENEQSLVATDQDVWLWNWDGLPGATGVSETIGVPLGTWEKYNSELTTTGTSPFGPLQGNALQFAALPPPRAYASFAYTPRGGSGAASGTGGSVQLFGGTPADPTMSSVPSANLVPQVAFPDQWYLGEGVPGVDTFLRGCTNPVPVPPDASDGGPTADQNVSAPPRKVATRNEIKEIARLPVLLGKDPKTASAGSPECLRRLDRERVSNTHLVTDPHRNRIYQFFICNTPNTGDAPFQRKILIEAYDASTLKPLGSAIAPMTSQFYNPNIGNVLHDAAGGRFFIRWTTEHIGTDLYVIQQDLIEKGVNPVVDKISGTWSDNMSVFTHPKTGRAKLLISNASSVVQFDLDDNRADWSLASVAGCSGGFSAGAMRVQDRVYTSCALSTGQSRYGVVRIAIDEKPNDTIANDHEDAGATEVFPGPYFLTHTWGDPQAERLVLDSDGGGKGRAMWVFDGKMSRYVGRLGVSVGAESYKFDEETGRLYMLARDWNQYGSASVIQEGGLMVLDTRLTPVPQVQNFGQFSYPAEASIGILPPGGGLPRRIFVRRAQRSTPSDPNDQNQVNEAADEVYRYPDGERIKLPDEMHYKVLADELPVPEQPTFDQLDALTVPVPESPGKTDVTFNAEGSGYGIRLRSVGGVASALLPPPSANGALLVPPFDPKNTPICFWPDRELMAGWVPQARLSDLETSATSSGLEVDSSSKADLEGVTSRCQVPVVGAATLTPTARPYFNTLWPLIPFTEIDSALAEHLTWNKHFKEVECAGDSTVTHTANIGDVYGSAACNQKTSRVVGTARGSAPGTGATAPAAAAAGYSVGEGNSSVVVSRESERGVVVTSTAVAKGIQLPGITIGYVKTEAVSWSNGRPFNGERATFTRTICRVSPPPNNHPEACLDPAAQQKMAKDFNDRMGINGKMYLPTPDPSYLKGSPGGYIAGVIKPIAEETEVQIFTRESQKEVPGLEIDFFKDSLTYGPGRQVLQLAAVRAVTGFGVQCGSDYVYSPSAKNCLELSFEDDPVEFEEASDEELSSSDDTETKFESGAGWEPVEAAGPPEGLALGHRIGRFVANLPLLRQLPIRQMGEALLAGSVWLLLSLPLALTARRFALNLARRS